MTEVVKPHTNVPTVPDNEFIDLFRELGGTRLAKKLGIALTNVHTRRRNLERKYHITILAPKNDPRGTEAVEYPHRFTLDIENGHVVVGSDAHYWPDRISTAHRAMVHMCEKLQPKAIIQNGDVLDGAGISRHPPIGWEARPSLIKEIEACTERLTELERAAPNAKKIWTLGNHDSRFETRLATVAPEYANVHGVHLKDHFPYWHPCWSAWINNDVVVKHRWKGGVHATHNNTMGSGKSIVTGHLHSLKVTPYSDYNGTRFGVDTGTLAEPGGPQFVDYCEDNPTNWRSGFAVLTFINGRLMWPEVVHVIGENEVEFRGEIISL